MIAYIGLVVTVMGVSMQPANEGVMKTWSDFRLPTIPCSASQLSEVPRNFSVLQTVSSMQRDLSCEQ